MSRSIFVAYCFVSCNSVCMCMCVCARARARAPKEQYLNVDQMRVYYFSPCIYHETVKNVCHIYTIPRMRVIDIIICIWMYVYVYMYVCVCVCVYIYIYIYIYIFSWYI